MSLNSIENKWNCIYRQADHVQYPPAKVLTDNVYLLPQSGTALDLASGLGGNALFLAECGLTVEAWDISSAAIEKLTNKANSKGLLINTKVRNINKLTFSGCAFDVIVVSRFLDRSICEEIISALNPEGLLFYQTYTRQKLNDPSPNNPDYLLAENELLDLFADLRVVFYRENGCIGNTEAGLRNEAQFIGQLSR